MPPASRDVNAPTTSSTLPRFIANGLFATAVHYLTLRGLVEFGGVGSVGLANGMAAIVGIFVSYLGNKFFVFRSRESVAGTLPKFLAVYSAVALTHFGFLTLWSDIWKLNYTSGFLIATAASTCISFVANRFFVFDHARSGRQLAATQMASDATETSAKNPADGTSKAVDSRIGFQTVRNGLLLGALLSCVAFLPQVLGKGVFPYDFEFYHIPLWWRTIDSIQTFSFPHFDPYIYSGIPFYDNTQSMIFYAPTNLYFLLLQFFRIEFNVYLSQFINVVHFAIGFAGFYAWGCWRGAPRWFAACLAIVAAFCGTWIGNAQHAGVIASLAWCPWLFLVTEQLLAQPTKGRIVVLGFILVLIVTAGFLPVILTIVIAWVCYAIILTVHGLAAARPQALSPMHYLRTSIALVAASCLGLAMTAPLWLPIIIAGVPKVALNIQGNSDLTGWLTAYSPGALRSFSLRRYVGLNDVTTTYHFSGLLPFLAIAFLLKPRAAIQSAPLVTAFLLFLLSRDAFGEARFVQAFPFLGVLYRPNLFEHLVIPLLALSLADIRPAATRDLAVRALLVFVVGLLGLAGYAMLIRKLDIDLVALLAMLMIAPLGFWLLKSADGWKLKAAIVALAAGPFLFNAFKDNQIWLSRTRPDSFSRTTVDYGFAELLAVLRKGEGPFRVAVDQQFMGGPWNGVWRVWQIETINGFEPNLDLTYRDYVLNGLAGWSEPRTFGRFDASSPKFDTLNVRYVVVTEQNLRSFAAHPDWKLVHDSHYRVFERRNFTPRFRAEQPSCLGNGNIEVRASQPGHQLLRIDARCPDTVILASERPHRRWEVLVDGRPVAWEAIDPAIGMRFKIPAGVSSVELRYRTPGLTLAVALSGLAILCCIGLLIAATRRGGIRKSASSVGRVST